jgi:hypothetical protein
VCIIVEVYPCDLIELRYVIKPLIGRKKNWFMCKSEIKPFHFFALFYHRRIFILLLFSIKNLLIWDTCVFFQINLMDADRFIVADPHHFDADPDPDPACHFDVDSNPACHFDPGIRILPFTLMRIRIQILASK